MSSYRPISNLTSHDSFQGDRAAGAGQTEAPPACVAELCSSTVGVPARTFNRVYSATAHHEQCVYGRGREEGYTVLVGLDLSAAYEPSTMTSSSAVSIKLVPGFSKMPYKNMFEGYEITISGI